MTVPLEDSDLPLPAIAVPAASDHPVLAVILAGVRERTAAAERAAAQECGAADRAAPCEPAPPPPPVPVVPVPVVIVSFYEDAP